MNLAENKTGITRDKLPVFEALIAERLRPTVTKEMGFQSYEKLEGDSTNRKAQEKQFLAGDLRNPILDYTKLDVHELEMMTIPLELVIDQAEHMSDPEAAHAVQTSAAYHQVEMYWLMKAKSLDVLKDDPQSPEFLEAAKVYQELNETLYGAPRPEIVEQAYGEVVAQGNDKQLDARAQTIYDELKNGTTVTIDGEQIVIPGMGGKEKGRLPAIDKEALRELKEVLQEKCGFIFDITDAYFTDIILARRQEVGDAAEFTTGDMKEVFSQVLHVMDPQNIAGITIAIMPNKTALSWDTPTMTVQIGEKRDGIDTPQDMATKIIHELYIHGGRAIAGLQSELPVLGTGLFTDAAPGKNASYLTFEEGFASIAEIASDDSSEAKWTPMYVSRYLAVASLYEGMDFRQAYEVNWRARVVLAAKDGEALTDTQILKEQRQAYLSCVRITRGTPTGLENKPVLTYNKDLAYLEGKMITLEYLASVKGDKKAIERLFTAKFDPTNPVQDALVTRYGLKDNR